MPRDMARAAVAVLGIASLLFVAGPVEGLVGRAAAPVMGFSTWNYFEEAINETLIREIAESLLSSGLASKVCPFWRVAWRQRVRRKGSTQFAVR